MSEEQIIDKVSMIDQWKVSGDSYTQGELDAIGQLLELYYDNKKQLEQEKNKELEKQLKLKNGDIDYISNKINNHFIDDVTLKNNYIRKDKIKEKIEFYKEKCVSDSYNKGFHNTRVDVLEELLEEV